MKRFSIVVSVVLNISVLVAVIGIWWGSAKLFRSLLHPFLSEAGVSFFEEYPIRPADVVFLGDSITAGGQWSEMFDGIPVRNRGIGGDRTDDVLERLDQITRGEPRKIFLLIGTNDLGTDLPQDEILANYEGILARLSEDSPDSLVYVQSVLPRGSDYSDRIAALNSALADLAQRRGLQYVELFQSFLSDDDSIVDELTYDELHLTGAGYRLWQKLLEPYVRS